MQAMKRDRKVEELKKTLKIENDLTVLSTRSELHLNAESHANRKQYLTTFDLYFLYYYMHFRM